MQNRPAITLLFITVFVPAALLTIMVSDMSYAFHEGGEGFCEGCHGMEGSENTDPPPNQRLRCKFHLSQVSCSNGQILQCLERRWVDLYPGGRLLLAEENFHLVNPGQIAPEPGRQSWSQRHCS